MERFDHPAMDLEPEYYPAMGEFIFRYAQLEYQMHEIVWFAVKLGYKEGRILTIGTDSRVLRSMLLTITSTDSWIASKTHKQEINSLCATSQSFNSMRNYLAHGSWQSPDATAKGATIHYMKQAEERLLPKRSKITHAEIYAAASKLKQMNALAQRLIVQLGGKAPTSLGRYAGRIRRSPNS